MGIHSELMKHAVEDNNNKNAKIEQEGYIKQYCYKRRTFEQLPHNGGVKICIYDDSKDGEKVFSSCNFKYFFESEEIIKDLIENQIELQKEIEDKY